MTAKLLTGIATLAALAAAPGTALASAGDGADPAGGAAVDQIAIATAGAILVTSALLALGIGHRSRRHRLLDRAAALAERLTGLPGWASLPPGIAAVSLLTAVFGMYWDISLHIDVGRDAGPLANPAHYFILAGLFGIFSAGFVAMVLPRGKPSATAVRISGDWHAPLGGVLICACGAFSLLGFPLDDLWHRIFGQDVTLWGPTHLMLIGGAAMTLVGIAVLLTEGNRAAAKLELGPREHGWVRRARLVALTGGLLIGLSTFQAEFDFGVPQFRFVFQPILIMLASSVALVAARVWLGRGAALGAVAFFLLIRGLLALLVGPVLDQTTPHFPLYLAEAAVVELVALRVSRDRPLALGLISGALIGSVGLAAEWGWSQLWMPLPWPAELLPEAALLGMPMAIAGALIGVWVGARLAGRPARASSLRPGAVVGAVAAAAIVAFPLYKPAEPGLSAQVALAPASSDGARLVEATVQLDPRDAADDAEWLTATAWQGGGLVVDRLERIGPGTYRTTEPIPVHGDWKAMIRLHEGNSLMGLPVYLPRDPAIPVGETPAPPSFTREFVADHELLQREQQPAPASLTALGYGVVVTVTLALLGLLAWGLHRLHAPVARPAAKRVRHRVGERAPARTGRGRLTWRRA